MKKVYDYWMPDRDNHFERLIKKRVNNGGPAEYQDDVRTAAYEYVSDFGLAIDVGANIGLWSVPLSKVFRQVISFEPVNSNFECLRRNVESLSNVTIYKQGLSDRDGTLSIQIPEKADNCGAYSIIDFKGYEDSLIEEEIQVRTLDSFELTPNLVKIDTQGFEEFVIRGAMKTLMTSRPVIVTECEEKIQNSSIYQLLSSFGYKIKQNVRKDYIWLYD